ncbi:hypothetical protein H334_04700 [Vibrio parahaemolyticus 901128]|nr:hypothetical protein H334_04700 [Vibrio parahaemolyticus 901128]
MEFVKIELKLIKTGRTAHFLYLAALTIMLLD